MKNEILKSITLGIFAVVTLYLSSIGHLPAWVLFMGLTIAAMFCKSIRDLIIITVEISLGMLLGFVMGQGIHLFGEWYGEIGSLIPPLVLITILYWVTKLKVFNNLIVYFLGLVTWFGYQSNKPSAMATLVACAVIGLVLGYAYHLISKALSK